uniref:Uncharacterized protein n=1 Tax=Rhizophora mucronata TaxID=61149 RepID=A0A2P2QTV0_RHIMU
MRESARKDIKRNTVFTVIQVSILLASITRMFCRYFGNIKTGIFEDCLRQ